MDPIRMQVLDRARYAAPRPRQPASSCAVQTWTSSKPNNTSSGTANSSAPSSYGAYKLNILRSACALPDEYLAY